MISLIIEYSKRASQLTGWRRRALAFALGVCATLALAPFYWFPLVVPAYAGLFLLVEAAPTRKAAFVDGWWWGWGFFISGLYWFCIALLTDAEKFGWAIPFALFGLNAIIALYPALACWLWFRLAERADVQARAVRAYLFALVWVLVEYARGHLFSGFPWNLAGYSLGFSDVSLQLASLFGAYGLSFVVVLLAVSVVARSRLLALIMWFGFACSLGWGAYRLANAVEGEPTGAVLRLVQGNVEQEYKWDPAKSRFGLEQYIQLTKSPGIERVTHVIWPETATPYAVRSQTALTYHLGEAIPENATLITGALRTQGQGEELEFFNSVLAINHAGQVTGHYDKHGLVPFGEFLPLRWLLPKAWTLPVGEKDFSRGEGAQTLEWPGLPPVSVLICYESVFPEWAIDRAHPPQWLLNVTNDAWFGTSTGPYQHFQMARMRAVEQGLPLVRVANTGISAVVDAYGRVLQRLDLEKSGIIDFQLKLSQLHDTTYRVYGDFLLPLLMVFGVILSQNWKKLIKN